MALPIFGGLLLAFNVDAGAVLAPVFAMVTIAYAFSIIIGGKPLRNFLPMVLWFVFGPLLVCVLLSAGIRSLRETLGALSPFVLILILTLLMVLSFLYVRWHAGKSSKDHRAELQTNERQPLFPAQDGGEALRESCAASESPSESSSEE